MSIGAKIKARREELGLKATFVYKRAGLSKQAYSSLENGHQQSSTKLGVICQVLGLNPEWVEFGKPPRLVSSALPPSKNSPTPSDVADAISMVRADHIGPSGGEEMATLIKEAVEMAFVLLSYPSDGRKAMYEMIRANAPSARIRQKPEMEPDPPPPEPEKRDGAKRN